MESYKQIADPFTQNIYAVQRLSDNAFIPFDPANTDYQKFKTDVLGGDTLENVDGVAMTQEEANAFIASLP